ncbi:hypothetical protein Ga0102493_112069 [Erythrobacter litoralis]|jgi:hypothetical protein|uniref:Uncharacterized protein n=1 Tax=Erythrobacter litoralis TaxID=39960 RepID=A0A074N501_9SPHN|nr:hypothetical protein [Erythrobacter litoralis]AOL23088.1 hypothetical protein Ga0102493_112069 [Erythrobacter litoralis]KEO93047.1 hypothetical protein EH32_12530 [Erythrobacter litoralis]MEE4339322.1 hypothetical protein [Erythrobacter sp.]
MKIDLFALGVVATAFVLHPTAFEQDTDAPEHEAEAMTDEPGKPCELHVWPTENYLGVKMGLLSGFGGIGAVADLAANKKGVTNVKTLMREYLRPEIQLAELEKLDYVTRLGLDPAQYRVVNGDRLVSKGIGQVKNPLENFPPKDDTMVAAAQEELRDAYSKGFAEWVEKKSGT